MKVLDLRCLESLALLRHEKLAPVDVHARVLWQVEPAVNCQQTERDQRDDAWGDLLVNLLLAPILRGERLGGQLAKWLLHVVSLHDEFNKIRQIKPRI